MSQATVHGPSRLLTCETTAWISSQDDCSASIRRFGLRFSGVLSRERLSSQEKLCLLQCKSSREERHPVEASFTQRVGCLGVL